MTRIATHLVHPPGMATDTSGASSTPIVQTATFDVGAGAGFDYSRSGNPTRDVLERQLARLDGASHAFAYASGVAAVDAVLDLARAGDHVVVSDDLYGGTVRLLRDAADRTGLSIQSVDLADLDTVGQAVTSRTRLVLAESLSNPRMNPADVAGLAGVIGGRPALLAVDNTMLSPYVLRPLELGADLVIQSATKLLGGHGDLTAGVVATDDAGLADRLAFAQNARGVALAPFESWLLLRGMATLTVRLDRQLESARAIAQWLDEQPDVVRVYYPADGSPRGVVISFETGDVGRSDALLRNTKLFRTTVSFGGVASSISRPLTMSHASIPRDDPRRGALPPDLVRLSVGLEDRRDLVDDLHRAFERARDDGVPYGIHSATTSVAIDHASPVTASNRTAP